MKKSKMPISLAAIVLVLSLLLSACGSKGSVNQPGPAPTPSESALPDYEITWSPRTEKYTAEEAYAAPADLAVLVTSLGNLKAIRYEDYIECRGIRYATAERFEKPVLVTKWDDAMYDATTWGDRSPQHLGFYYVDDSLVSQWYEDENTVNVDTAYTEDCLNLNIWTPVNAENCPVLVYFHGGSYLNGSGSNTEIDGAAYAQHGIITVSINYRMNAFATPMGDGYTSNLALHDELASLRWVHQFIADFGGDPSRVTIMGESAGASGVQNLLASPLMEEGLVSGAIMLSGGGDLSDMGTPANPINLKNTWDLVKQDFGVSTIQELKTVNASKLFTSWVKNGGKATPVIDGYAIPDTVGAALDNNTIKNVPVIISMTANDMYPLSLYTAAVDYGTKRVEKDGAPVYLSYLGRVLPGENAFGAYHGSDLYYVFGTLYRNWREMEDVDYAVCVQMVEYFSNFIKTGNPNCTALPTWEPVSKEKAQFMNFEKEQCAMFDPDVDTLLTLQQADVPFPYSNGLVTHSGMPVPSKFGADEEVDITVSPEDLMGTWAINGYTASWDQSFTPITDQTFVFDGEAVSYYIGAGLASRSYYSFVDEYNIGLKSDPSQDSVLNWRVYWSDEDELLIDDPSFGAVITYVCVPADEDTGRTQSSSSGSRLSSATAEDLDGVWKITGYAFGLNGMPTATPGEDFTFDPSVPTATYNKPGAPGKPSPYTLAEVDGETRICYSDEYYWVASKDKNGNLILKDSLYVVYYGANSEDDASYLYYFCER